MSDVQVSYGPAPVESPSEAVIKDANRVVVATDGRGRKLGIKRMSSGLSRFRLARILGPDAGNPAVMTEAMLYTAVVSINGDPVPFPQSVLQLEALIDRLDIEVLHLIHKVQQDEFGLGRAFEETVAEAKN
jgi:hypothetical protein